MCLFSSSPNELSQQDFSILVGKSYMALYRCIKQLSQTSLSLEIIDHQLEKFAAEKYQEVNYQELFRKAIVQILLYARKNHIKVALVSSFRYQHIIEVLTSWGNHFYLSILGGSKSNKSSQIPTRFHVSRRTQDRIGLISSGIYSRRR